MEDGEKIQTYSRFTALNSARADALAYFKLIIHYAETAANGSHDTISHWYYSRPQSRIFHIETEQELCLKIKDTCLVSWERQLDCWCWTACWQAEKCARPVWAGRPKGWNSLSENLNKRLMRKKHLCESGIQWKEMRNARATSRLQCSVHKYEVTRGNYKEAYFTWSFYFSLIRYVVLISPQIGKRSHFMSFFFI